MYSHCGSHTRIHAARMLTPVAAHRSHVHSSRLCIIVVVPEVDINALQIAQPRHILNIAFSARAPEHYLLACGFLQMYMTMCVRVQLSALPTLLMFLRSLHGVCLRDHKCSPVAGIKA